jgi:hypothetical protein
LGIKTGEGGDGLRPDDYPIKESKANLIRVELRLFSEGGRK